MIEEEPGAEFVFKADGVSLDTLPLARVSTYLDRLAELFGDRGSVHLVAVSTGSFIARARVEQPAVDRVWDRVTAAGRRAGPGASARQKIDDLLAEDRAIGRLVTGGDGIVLISFAEPQAPAPVIPAFWQDGSIRGELVRLEGEDDTKHGALAGPTGNSVFRCPPELAAQLRHHMWEFIHLRGRGRWRRNPRGEWELLDFDADAFDILDRESVAVTVGRLREHGGFGLQPGDIAELQKLRAE
jgi:hypothetical protein